MLVLREKRISIKEERWRRKKKGGRGEKSDHATGSLVAESRGALKIYIAC